MFVKCLINIFFNPRRIFEVQRAKNELQWERFKMVDEMNKLHKEITVLEDAALNKTNGLKLAETRLENRIFRPGPELVQDDAQVNNSLSIIINIKINLLFYFILLEFSILNHLYFHVNF